MVNGKFSAELMLSQRLEGDKTFGLPPGSPSMVFPIDVLPGSPDEWSREEGSYVVPVSAEVGLWFDWRDNDNRNTAVLPSVKGMNPITGRQIDGPGLECYMNKCPIHGMEFSGPNLVCDECGFAWPPQNYVTDDSTLWWDGFRQPDGTVRQFFFTEDERRDIASHVIGKHNTVPAFGFVFYEPKDEHRRKKIDYGKDFIITTSTPFASKNLWYSTSSTPTIDDGNYQFTGGNDVSYTGSLSTSVNMVRGSSASFGAKVGGSRMTLNRRSSSKAYTNDPPKCKGGITASNSMQEPRHLEPFNLTAEVSVGAGAKIRQNLSSDSLGIEKWQETPSGMIRLYFCFEDQFRQIVERGGVRGLQTNDDGFLAGIPVG